MLAKQVSKQLLISMFLTLCYAMDSKAQDFDDFAEKDHHISVDPLLPFFGTAQIQYERSIKNRFSFNLSLGYKFSSGSIDVASIEFDRFISEELDFRGLKLIPEFRWYMQKSHSGLSGFYVGIFFKYQDFKTELAGDYTSVEREQTPILIDATLQSLIVGAEVGYKLRLGSNFFVDFIIAGPGKSYNTLVLDEVLPVPDAFYDDLTEALKDIGIFDLINPDFQINGNQKTKIQLPAFRYGIKIGYAF